MTKRKTPQGDEQLDIFTACYADIAIRDHPRSRAACGYVKPLGLLGATPLAD